MTAWAIFTAAVYATAHVALAWEFGWRLDLTIHRPDPTGRN